MEIKKDLNPSCLDNNTIEKLAQRIFRHPTALSRIIANTAIGDRNTAVMPRRQDPLVWP